MIWRAFAIAAVLATSAWADDQGEREARALFREGNRLIEQGDYVGALDLYRTAYSRWPNPKILLNMGTALRQLGRDAEAADTYEQYLASPEADPAKRPDVEKVFAELSARLACLRIHVSEAGARVLVDGKPKGEFSGSPLAVRVEPGTHTVVAEKPGQFPALATVAVSAGEVSAVNLAFPVNEATVAVSAAEPEPALATAATTPSVVRHTVPEPVVTSLAHTSQLGALLRVDVDGKGRGAVGTVAASYGVTSFADVLLGAMLGSNKGAYVGANAFFLSGAWKPLFQLGFPVFFVEGPRVGIHTAAGLQYDVTRTFGFLLEAGVQYYPSVPNNYEKLLFVPSLGVQGRL